VCVCTPVEIVCVYPHGVFALREREREKEKERRREGERERGRERDGECVV